MDTELRYTTLDLSGVTTATLSYVASYNDFGTGSDFSDVDVRSMEAQPGSTCFNGMQTTAQPAGEAVALDWRLMRVFQCHAALPLLRGYI